MSKYVSKRIASVQTRNGSSLWYLLEDTEGEEKKVSPAGFYRTPVPDTTDDYVKEKLLKQLFSQLQMREFVEVQQDGFKDLSLDEQLAKVQRVAKTAPKKGRRWDRW